MIAVGCTESTNSPYQKPKLHMPNKKLKENMKSRVRSNEIENHFRLQFGSHLTNVRKMKMKRRKRMHTCESRLKRVNSIRVNGCIQIQRRRRSQFTLSTNKPTHRSDMRQFIVAMSVSFSLSIIFFSFGFAKCMHIF